MIHSILHYNKAGEGHQCTYNKDGKHGAGYYCTVCNHVDVLDKDWVDLPFDNPLRECYEKDLEQRRWGEFL